ncbi:MAG: serine acetyltransferase [Candidatus Omnitrophica bacterium]|nr:serine acetyltransferase [Candidatus Omnitrophota bacterium]
MKILKDLQQKAYCYYEKKDQKSVLRVLLADGTSANVLYRMARFFIQCHLGIIGWFLLDVNKFLNGCVIGRGVEFDEGLVFMHPVGVVINGGVKGGKNIVIESGVVIGAAKNGLPVQVPVLGNDVFIGSGAKILGGITVGNNVKIGANAVVVKNVPDNATVVGIPGRVVQVDEE